MHQRAMRKPLLAVGHTYHIHSPQDGWDRRGRPPAVLVEGDWALLTCTPGREGPTGGRDRLQLVKLGTRAGRSSTEVCRARSNIVY